jgi:excisionase family DNA binding protein
LLQAHIAKGSLAHYRLGQGRLLRIRRSDLLAWIEAGRVEAKGSGA